MMLLSSSRDRRTPFHLAALLALLVSCLLGYFDIFSHDFIDYDDTRIILDRIDAYDGWNLENLKGILLTDFPREEPLIVRDLSYLANASIFGVTNPFGYLFGNWLLHLLVSYCVYLLCLVLFPEKKSLALVSALLFSLHPIHVESVAWISSRKDTLYSLWYLLALLVYARYLVNKKSILLVASFGLFTLSLYSKAGAVSFLPMVLFFRFVLPPCPDRDSDVGRRGGFETRPYTRPDATHGTLPENGRNDDQGRDVQGAATKPPIHLPEIIFLAGVFSLTVFFRHWYTGILFDYGVLTTIKSLPLEKPLLWVNLNAEVITFYLGKLVFPHNLAPMYSFPNINKVYEYIPFLLFSISVVAMIGYAMFHFLKRGLRQELFIIAWFLIALLPYLNLTYVNIYVADRYLYLASISFCIGVAALLTGFYAYCRRRSVLFQALALLTISLYSIMSLAGTRNAVKSWENTLTFWKNIHEVSPMREEGYDGMMKQYLRYYTDDSHDAMAALALTTAKEIGLDAMARFCDGNSCSSKLHPIAHRLGLIAWYEHDAALADSYFALSLKLNPHYLSGYYNYAAILIEQKRFAEALTQVDLLKKNASSRYKDQKILHDLDRILLPAIQTQTGP